MTPIQHNSSDADPQFLGEPTQKLLGRFAVSGNALLSAGLCYGLLLCYVLVAYTVVVAVGGTNASRPSVPLWLNVVALLVIVPTFLPVHGWLRRNVNQIVYGQYDDPYAVLTKLNQRLETHVAPDALLPTLASTLAATLNLPFVAIETNIGAQPLAARYGTSPPHAEHISLPLAYRTAMLGTLHVSSRRPYERLSADDVRLLVDLARQVSITLHAAQLNEALQASREQLVLAREEERRRIRRDLHDGLGPTLAALRLQLGALRTIVHTNPEHAEQVINELRADVRDATAEIRRLVYDLRPPMLDEFGLVGALRNLQVADANLIHSVDAPDPMPVLPAALEVALYRIAAEALHNVARHAAADRCSIRIETTETLITLRVSDNGCGLPPHYLAGVGHRSIQERAAELGGSVAFLPAAGGGTCVQAVFPVQALHHE